MSKPDQAASPAPADERPDSLSDLLDSRHTLGERLFLGWDLAIMLLVAINLTLIIVDTLYGIGPIGHLLHRLLPGVARWYGQHVHANFQAIDLAFVAVFVLDVLAGWLLAVVQRRYVRWYFYPFVRWYDVLGCMPLAGFRFLRVLRVISITIRLQRLEVIDIRHWWLYRQIGIYYDIVVEEISDRVVLRVLSGAQMELESGGQELSRQIMNEVVAPRQQRLTRSASSQIEAAIIDAYQDNRDEIQRYIANVVNRAVDENPALKNLERVPMLGTFVSHALDSAISDTVNNVLDEAVSGLSSEAFDQLVENIADSVMERLMREQTGDTGSEIRDAIVEILELVKSQVAIKRWRGHFE